MENTTATTTKYSVRRLEPETVLYEMNSGTRQVGVKTQRHVSYAVVDENGKIARAEDKQWEIYPRKAVAQMVADNYNGKIPTTINQVALSEEASATRVG